MRGFAGMIMGLAATLLSACATAPRIPHEAGAGVFLLEQDLVGRASARGEFRTITGMRRAFTAELDGAWDGRVLILREDFLFDDGERDQKTWRLTRVAPGRYEGTREDVVGVARGFQDGRAFRLEYDLRLPGRDGRRGRVVRFRDVMVRASEGVVINRATIGWRGLRVGGVVLSIRRAP